jgi:lysophospholipase L1-like esterase
MSLPLTWTKVRNVGLIGFAVFALLEIALRIHNPIYVPLRADQIELPVNRVFTMRNPNNKKVDELLVNSYNGIGLRGPNYPPKPEEFVKIITVGGSTTACVTLTDGRTWPDLLARKLVGPPGRNVWLNNAGMNGHSTFGHAILLDRHLYKFKPDFILYLVGINDVGRDDLNHWDYELTRDGLSLRNRIVAASEVLSTAQVLNRMRRAFDEGINIHSAHDLTQFKRVHMDAAERQKRLQIHRTNFLRTYRKRVEHLIVRTRAMGARPVLITQPALMGTGQDPTTGIELGDLQYNKEIPASLEWEILELYNNVVRELAAQYGVILVDAARSMPKDSLLYFDWIHYSVAGAEVMAEVVRRVLQPYVMAVEA